MKGLIFQPTKAALIREWDFATSGPMETRRVVKVQPPSGLWARRNDEDEDDTSGWIRFITKCPFKLGEKRYVKEPWRPIFDGVEWIEYFDGSRYKVPRELDAHPELDLNAEWTGLHDRGEHWRNPLFMPEWAARTIITLTAVGVERVCDISEASCIAEGIEPQRSRIPCWNYRIWTDAEQSEFGSASCYSETAPTESPVGYGIFDVRQNGWSNPSTAKDRFESHWESIHGKKAPWETTWVWAISFNRVTP